MSVTSSQLFNASWYLAQNPDVAAAVAKGLTTAEDHFLVHGAAEGRAPGPLFNPQDYLANNTDVATAVSAGLTTAVEHFIEYGAAEGRSPLSLFNAEFYLSQNADVAAAVASGAMTAVEHFLAFGLSEQRSISPFIDLAAYLSVPANADVAVSGMSPLVHLLQYGIAEGRSLGNGIDTAIFADDPAFAGALTRGDAHAALERVAEVAPFLPSFQPPAGWKAPADTVIPVDFIPPTGTKLVVPESVPVPEGVILPGTFEQAPQPGPGGDTGGTGGGSAGQPTNGTVLTAGVDNFLGTDSLEIYHASVAGSLESADTVSGVGESNALFIGSGAIKGKAATPTLNDIQVIGNGDVSDVISALDGGTLDWSKLATLNLSKAPDVQRIWSDFSQAKYDTGLDGGPRNMAAVYTEASLETVYGIRGAQAGEGVNTFASTVDISFKEGALDSVDSTLKVELMANKASSISSFGWNKGAQTGIEHMNVVVGQDNGGFLHVHSDDLQTLTVSGEGSVDIVSLVQSKSALTSFDASGVSDKGAVSFTSANITGPFIAKGGAGANTLDFSRAAGAGTIEGGGGADTLVGGMGNDVLRGGEGNDMIALAAGGSDTVKFEASAALNGLDHIIGFQAGATKVGGDVLDFSAFIDTDNLQGIEGNAAYVTGALDYLITTPLISHHVSNKIFLWQGDHQTLQGAMQSLPTGNGLYLATGEKAIALLKSGALDSAAGEFSIAYLHGSANGGPSIDIVGSVHVDASNALTAENFGLQLQT